LCYPYNLGEQHIELRCKVDLLRGRQRLAPAYGHVQMGIRDLPGRILKVVHRIFERPTPAAVVVRYLAKRVCAKKGGHVVKQSTREHRRRKVGFPRAL
jgi:hypothetical protein